MAKKNNGYTLLIGAIVVVGVLIYVVLPGNPIGNAVCPGSQYYCPGVGCVSGKDKCFTGSMGGPSAVFSKETFSGMFPITEGLGPKVGPPYTYDDRDLAFLKNPKFQPLRSDFDHDLQAGRVPPEFLEDLKSGRVEPSRVRKPLPNEPAEKGPQRYRYDDRDLAFLKNPKFQPLHRDFKRDLEEGRVDPKFLDDLRNGRRDPSTVRDPNAGPKSREKFFGMWPGSGAGSNPPLYGTKEAFVSKSCPDKTRSDGPCLMEF